MIDYFQNSHMTATLEISLEHINPVHATGFFIFFLIFSGVIEKDQWYEMGKMQILWTNDDTIKLCSFNVKKLFFGEVS